MTVVTEAVRVRPKILSAKHPRKIPSNLAQTPAAAEGHTTISPIKNIHEYDPSVVHTPNSMKLPQKV